MKNVITWNMLSRYRSQLSGIAILWIMIFHIVEIKSTKLFGFFDYTYGFLVNGNIGVEIFLLLSGLGLYYSYSRNENMMEFYCKRMKRIFLPYLIISGVFFFFNDVIITAQPIVFFKNLTTLSFWESGNRAFWFIALILPLYVFYPVIHRFILNNRRPFILTLMAIVIVYISLIFLKFYDLKEYVKVEIALTRIPIFLMGCYIGKLSHECTALNLLQRVAILCTIIIGIYAFNDSRFPLITWKALRFYYFILGISMTWMFVILLDFLQSNFINKLLGKVGDISLELYLSHLAILHTVNKTAFYRNSDYKTTVLIISVFIGAIILSVIVNKFIVPGINKLAKG